MPVKSTLFKFWQQKEIELGRNVTVAEVSRATGLHRDTIKRLLDDETTRFDKPVIEKLCDFFGVPEGPIPFLYYEREKS